MTPIRARAQHSRTTTLPDVYRDHTEDTTPHPPAQYSPILVPRGQPGIETRAWCDPDAGTLRTP